MKVPGFAGPTYPAASAKWDSERCINQYPENAVVAGQNAPVALISRPGLKAWKEVGTGPIRALHVPRAPGALGDIIAVSGNQVYRITAAAVSTLVGTISSGTTQVSISDNGIDAIIVDGTANGWTVNLTTNAIAAISQPGFYGGTKVDFINGRFILNKPGTQVFYWSGLYNTTFNALDFASAEGIPDKIQTLAIINREVWLFGDYSKDVYYNSTDTSNPFQSLQGGFSLVGCVSPRSVAVFETVVFWVGWSGQSTLGVYRSEGYQARRISPPAIERLLASRSNNEQLVGYTYSEDSHVFYVLHSINANDTALVYDMATDQWHERGFTLSLIPAFNLSMGYVNSNGVVVGGVTGLTGSGLVLQNNGGDNLPISFNGAFTFPTPVVNLAPYNVTVLTQPTGQTCTVTNGAGTINGASVNNVAVNCVTASLYTISGNITDPNGCAPFSYDVSMFINSILVAGPVNFTSPGPFTFPSSYPNGTSYAVTATKTLGCASIEVIGGDFGGSGTIAGANVTNIVVRGFG